MKRTELAVLFLILAIAGAFRLWDLNITPPGLSPNEAINGTTAQEAIESGHYRIYYPREGGRQGLFINLQALSVRTFGNHPWSLRLVSALLGIFTVLGTYLLARRLFDNGWIAAIAAFLMATGFWHVAFSRIGVGAIMGPLCAVWALYYFYKGLETTRIWPWLLAGFWLGLGFHTSPAFGVVPGIFVVVLAIWFWSTHRTFGHEKFAHARAQLIGSAALMVAVMVIILIPIASHLGTPWQTPPSNASGMSLLFLPVSVLFAVGLARSIWKVGRTLRTHNHPSVVQILLLCWLLVGLITSFRDVLIAPAVYIIAAEGLWWLYVWLERWYSAHSPKHHGNLVVTATLIIFLFALGVADGKRYFVNWGHSPSVATAFNQSSLELAARLAAMPPATLKYVVATDNGSAQSVMFLTDTGTPAKQVLRHLYYLTPEQYAKHQYPNGAVIVPLNP